jgi:hypothetical protein
MRELAERLLAESRRTTDPHEPQALVNEELRLSLVRVAGVDGIATLLRRALALATADTPALQCIKVGINGRFEGMEHLVEAGKASRDAASIAVTLKMLDLLVTFIGEGLTRRLVREVCPEASPRRKKLQN